MGEAGQCASFPVFSLLRDNTSLQEAVRKQKERDERIKREFERRMNPTTKEDFDILYHALESMC